MLYYAEKRGKNALLYNVRQPYTWKFYWLIKDRTPLRRKAANRVTDIIGVARGGQGTMPPQFLAYRVILCFERGNPKQNNATRL